MLEMRHQKVVIMGTSVFAKWSWFLGDAFEVTLRYKDRVHHLLHTPERKFAWFVLEDEASPHDREHSQEIRQRLPKP